MQFIIAGVGGQGILFASRVLGHIALSKGLPVNGSEVHGMSQRGGSVTTQVRFGGKVYSPIIDKGQADILVSFEAMEALRWLGCLRVGGKVVVNDHCIPTATTALGKQTYPSGVVQTLADKVGAKVVDATRIATQLGNPRAMNIVLFGALVKAMDLLTIDWPGELAKHVKPALLDINLQALEAGIAQ